MFFCFASHVFSNFFCFASHVFSNYAVDDFPIPTITVVHIVFSFEKEKH